MKHCELTLDQVRDVLTTKGNGRLFSGAHMPIGPDGKCAMCVRELRAVACGFEWTDTPDGKDFCMTDLICQGINDGPWSNYEARTSGAIVLALLSEHTAPEGWFDAFHKSVVQQILPIAFRAALNEIKGDLYMDAKDAIDRCETEGTADAARKAAWLFADTTAVGITRGIEWFDATIENTITRTALLADDRDAVLRLAVKLLLTSHGREDLIPHVK